MKNIRRSVMITLAAALFAVMAPGSSFAALTNNPYYNAPPKSSFLHTKPRAAAHHIVKTAPRKKNDFANLNR